MSQNQITIRLEGKNATLVLMTPPTHKDQSDVQSDVQMVEIWLQRHTHDELALFAILPIADLYKVVRKIAMFNDVEV